MRLGCSILYVASLPGTTTTAFSANELAATLTDVAVATAGPDRPAPPVELGLVTEQVEAAYDRAVAAGAVAVKSPARKPWGQLVADVRDDNGCLVELCSPLTD